MTQFHLPSVVKCPSCGRTNGVPTRGGVFDCMFCGAPIDLNRMPSVQSLQTSTSTSSPSFYQPRDEAPPLPAASYNAASENAYDPGSNVLMTYTWRRPSAVLALLGSLAYLGFVLFFFAGDFFDGNGISNWLFVVIALSLLYSALTGIYRSIAQLLNTTSLRRQDGALVAVHRPVPWGGARVNIAEINRIVVEGGRPTGRNRSVRQNVAASLKDKRKVILIPDVKSPAEAQQMADDLAQRLGLERQPSNLK